MPKILEIIREPVMDLAEMQRQSMKDTIPGYPPREDRLTFTRDRWQQMVADQCIEFPAGPHYIDLANRYNPAIIDRIDHIITPANPATPEQRARWLSAPLKTSLGLPLHPLAEIGFTTVFEDGGTIGMFTGPGRMWYFGADLTSNLGVRRVREGIAEYLAVGVVKRSGKLEWSLPGGHAEPGQNAYEAALDEGEQETGFSGELAGSLSGHLVQTVPHLHGPNTAVAWLDERYLMLDGEGVDDLLAFTPNPRDTEEVQDSRWMSVAEMEALNKAKAFMSTHLIEIMAFEATREKG